ncbi:hypothetical protein ACVH9Z_12020 [Rhodococcus opacus]|uniref:50S ribosomal protein L29 n=1 Tax=Rhodococcus opacus TaxID=37919 RepID=A0AAX3YGY5_RHOOP|nr:MULTISPECIES: hypothetical protein [Rhodococcus]ELB91300.1 hypothetical protein Rwratislav_19874 [Rhodococcus wratislaviensis IFP 2016]NHU43081.1 hypothetical protein [Rhodococcus sp. A14]MBA8958497.1 hypothetical protein [Rhodococcus opacus]MBP2204062.1 hypothetical protein [Rhodococcus opacus]MCZ4588013.1 hypothetical protein [Rhodococcus opacus]
MKKILNSLSEEEFVLIRETKKAQMADLDEDKLITLHTRIRRARNKHVKLYRQEGAVKVADKGARGAGKAANTRNADKVEVFEAALSRVSGQLATAARASARELKDERLARARSDSPSFSELGDSNGKVGSSGKERADATRKSSGRKKFEASTIAAGARRQAKKDKR